MESEKIEGNPKLSGAVNREKFKSDKQLSAEVENNKSAALSVTKFKSSRSARILKLKKDAIAKTLIVKGQKPQTESQINLVNDMFKPATLDSIVKNINNNNNSARNLTNTMAESSNSNNLHQTPMDQTAEDNANWQQQPARRRQNSKILDQVPKKIPTYNRFGILTNTDQEDNTSQRTNVQQSTQQTKRKWVPPITITSQIKDYKKLIVELKIILEHDKFQVQFNNKTAKIFLYNNDDFDKICFELKQQNIQYFTLTKPENKVKKIVLKAPPSWESDQIKESLLNEGKKINEIIPLRSKKGNSHSFLVTLPGEQKINEIKTIRTLENVKVKWEHYAKKKNYTQCYRCQEFGHAKFNCNNRPRCVKCKEFHLYTECTLIKSEDTIPFCHNCKGDHAANYSKCPKLLEYLEKRREQTQKNNNNNIRQNFENFENQNFNKNFPNTLNNNFENIETENRFNRASYREKLVNPPNQNTDDNDFTDVIKFIKIIKQLKIEIRNCKDDFEKMEIILKYIHLF